MWTFYFLQDLKKRGWIVRFTIVHDGVSRNATSWPTFYIMVYFQTLDLKGCFTRIVLRKFPWLDGDHGLLSLDAFDAGIINIWETKRCWNFPKNAIQLSWLLPLVDSWFHAYKDYQNWFIAIQFHNFVNDTWLLVLNVSSKRGISKLLIWGGFIVRTVQILIWFPFQNWAPLNAID
jgi:hypothetical protein